MLDGKRIGLFITGGIAAYKMADLSRQLIKKGAQVKVAMSEGACEFLSPLTMQVLTKNPVFLDVFNEDNPDHVQHIALADWMDYALLAPASANTIAKLANGMADNAVTTSLLAANCPRLLVPSMNTKMYSNPATTRNLNQLKADGWSIMEPETGFLAEGYSGKGRLPNLESIVSQLETLVAQNELDQVLEGKNVLISAGGTRERIDPVRYITNDSSGKMGQAIAQAAIWFGAGRVKLVSANPNLTPPVGVELIQASSANQLLAAMEANYTDSDYVIMAAAISDYRVQDQAQEKIKKGERKTLTINLVENPDILASLGRQKKDQVLVGFAAETSNLIENAQTKLKKKNADWIIANDVSRSDIGFNVDQNQVTMLSRSGEKIELAKASKIETACQIWQKITKGAN